MQPNDEPQTIALLPASLRNRVHLTKLKKTRHTRKLCENCISNKAQDIMDKYSLRISVKVSKITHLASSMSSSIIAELN